MHIILDANIYAADYRMQGVSFQALFEYMRRTNSKIVLPHAIREEVVADYGRRLKSESKEFGQIWNRYRHLDLGGDPGVFKKPNITYEMKVLRQKLMKPMEGVTPLYVPELKGTFIEQAFMRGVTRTRPANGDGEELRDVIIWLWALEYCASASAEVAFISADSGFWEGDHIHPQVQKDTQSKNGRIAIYRSIPDFLQQHAPAPVTATQQWVEQNFQVQAIEAQLIDRAWRELSAQFRGEVRDVAIESLEFLKGAMLSGFNTVPTREGNTSSSAILVLPFITAANNRMSRRPISTAP